MLFDIKGGAEPVAVLDWQTVTVGKAMTDVGYFMGCGIGEVLWRKHEDHLLELWLGEMAGRGVTMGREPLHKLRLVLDECEGISVDLTFTSRAFPIEEPSFTHRIGPRAFMDYTRMTQNGHYEGWISTDGDRRELAEAQPAHAIAAGVCGPSVPAIRNPCPAPYVRLLLAVDTDQFRGRQPVLPRQ